MVKALSWHTKLERRVRRKRELAGISLREAEVQSGVSFNVIARFERGDFPWRSLLVMNKLAEWCGFEIVLVRKRRGDPVR